MIIVKNLSKLLSVHIKSKSSMLYALSGWFLTLNSCVNFQPEGIHVKIYYANIGLPWRVQEALILTWIWCLLVCQICEYILKYIMKIFYFGILWVRSVSSVNVRQDIYHHLCGLSSILRIVKNESSITKLFHNWFSSFFFFRQKLLALTYNTALKICQGRCKAHCKG